jgi:hypothetical protein
VLADAGINTQHDAVTVRVRPLDHRHAHSVAVRQAMRDVRVHTGAESTQRCEQDDDRHRAIHVVVAVDENLFLALDCAAQALDRPRHVRHSEGVMEVGERWMEKPLRRFRLRDIAQGQQPRHQQRNAEFAGQFRDCFRIDGGNLPAHGVRIIVTEDAFPRKTA